MRKIIWIVAILFSVTGLLAKSYAKYRYIASMHYERCFRSTNYHGVNMSAPKLLRSGHCTVQNENENLGALILFCSKTPARSGPQQIIYATSLSGCQSALEAFSQMR